MQMYYFDKIHFLKCEYWKSKILWQIENKINYEIMVKETQWKILQPVKIKSLHRNKGKAWHAKCKIQDIQLYTLRTILNSKIQICMWIRLEVHIKILVLLGC